MGSKFFKSIPYLYHNFSNEIQEFEVIYFRCIFHNFIIVIDDNIKMKFLDISHY